MPKVVFSQNGANIVVNDPAVAAPSDAAQLLIAGANTATIPALLVRYDGSPMFYADQNVVKLPVKTTTERDAIVTGANVGLLVFNSTTQQLNERRSGTWQAVGIPVGGVMPYAGSAAPAGYLICNGDTVPNGSGTVQSITADFSALFAVLGSSFGAAGRLPDTRSKVPLGSGAGSFVESVVSKTASANSIPVASNNSLWITGKQVVLSGVSGFSGISNGTYWVIRVSSTAISFANSLANAVAGTVLGVSGTGSLTLTESLTSRSLGELGGGESHALTTSEMPAHVHSGAAKWPGNGPEQNQNGGVEDRTDFNINSGSTGGSGSHNNMMPFLALNYIIKY